MRQFCETGTGGQPVPLRDDRRLAEAAAELFYMAHDMQQGTTQGTTGAVALMLLLAAEASRRAYEGQLLFAARH